MFEVISGQYAGYSGNIIGSVVSESRRDIARYQGYIGSLATPAILSEDLSLDRGKSHDISTMRWVQLIRQYYWNATL